LQNNVPPPSPKAPPFNLGACEAYMASQVVNEMANYEQYVFDAHVGYQYLAADGSQS
jgi:hypothetical protein